MIEEQKNYSAKPMNVPKSENTEKCLLGYILAKGQPALMEVVDRIKPEDFWSITNRNIYTLICNEYRNKKEFTLAALRDRTKIKPTYLVELMNSHWLPTEIQKYIKELKRTSNLRKLISAGVKIQELGFKETQSIDDILKVTNKLLAGINSDKDSRLKDMNQMLVESMQRYDDRAKTKGIVGVETGFKELDDLLHGLRKGSLNILAARPAIGKTSCAMNIAVNSAKKKNRILIFSLEQSSEELVDKMICSEGQISLWGMQGGYVNDKIDESYANAITMLASLKILIDDNGGITPAHIISTIERLTIEEPLDLVIVDYLQLMNSGIKTNGKVEDVTYVSQGLKTIAKNYNLPILALAQLNRALEIRGDKEPKLADLRDSGSIEQDSDVVMFLKRDFKSGNELQEAQITIAKHRAGPMGMVDLLFDPKSTSFKNKADDGF